MITKVAAPPRTLARRLLPLQIAIALQGLILWVPIEKLFMTQIGFDAASVGVMAAAYAAVVPLLEVPSGILADRWSRVWIMILGCVALMISSLIGGLSHSVIAYVIAAMVLGIYFAFSSGTVDSVVYDTVLEETGSNELYETSRNTGNEPKESRVGGALGGVHDHAGPRNIRNASIQTPGDVHEPLELWSKRPARTQQLARVPNARPASLQRGDLGRVDPLAATPTMGEDLRPDRALEQRLTAATYPVLDEPTLPQIAQLSRGEEPVDRSQQVVEDRAAAPAPTHDVENRHALSARRHRFLLRRRFRMRSYTSRSSGSIPCTRSANR